MKTTSKTTRETSPDLFENPILNKLTRTHIAFPVSIFFLYAAGLLYYTIVSVQLSVGTVVGLFFSGLLLFTFAEYAIHRWVYHPPEDASQGFVDFTYKVHGIHHAYPKDKQRLAMPPWLSALVATVLLFVFEFLLGRFGFSLLAGFLTGYASYLLVHYVVHIFPMPKNRLKALWVNHAIHHYSEDEILFGVSSPLWDYVFGTLPEKDWQQEISVKKGSI
ncbi:MAG: sterol desaturase family protein [Bacteroidota bacterium]